MHGIFCLLSAFLSRCASPSDTRWCNTSKEINILNICWSQTSCYGAALFIQSWVKFAYVFRPFPPRARVEEMLFCWFLACPPPVCICQTDFALRFVYLLFITQYSIHVTPRYTGLGECACYTMCYLTSCLLPGS